MSKKNNLINKRKKIDWWQKEELNLDFFNLNKYVFFSNNYIFIYLLLIFNNIKWVEYFTKYKYYNNIILLSKIFFFSEFILKIDYNIFFFYRKYIDYFRIVKYNEYLLNNILLYNFPKLKWFLRYSINKLDLDRIYRKNIMLCSFYLYKINIMKDIFFFNYVDKISISYDMQFYNFNKGINQYMKIIYYL
jgi:hypothetical protein